MTNKLICAIYLDQKIEYGGGYQQSLNATISALHIKNKNIDFICFTNILTNITILTKYGITAHHLNLSKYEKLVLTLRRRIISNRFIYFLNKVGLKNPLEKFLFQHGVDIIYFTSPSDLALDLESTNYIYTVWDLSHRDDVEFPEVRNLKEFENREYKYNLVLKKSCAVIVDSRIGKSNTVHRYGLDPNRVYIIPFKPAESVANISSLQINIKDHYGITNDYIFYPAQLWAHKNHAYVLSGIANLEEDHGIKVSAVFCGSDKGNLNYIKKLAIKLKIDDRIHILGFVDNEIIPELYKQSIALVMPTYFGPTNLPPLEAFKLKVPVIYSQIESLTDQVRNAALKVDLKDSRTLSETIFNLLSRETIKEELIHNGLIRLEEISSINDSSVIEDILINFYYRLSTWKNTNVFNR